MRHAPSLLISVLVASSTFAQPRAGLGFQEAEEDPFLWLEDVTAETSLDWVRARNEATTTELAGEGFDAMQERILAILDSDQRIPRVSKIGGHYYNLWRDAEHPRGLWRRTTPAEYAKEEPAWETVLDVDALGEAEGESWVWHGAQVLEPEDRRCLISLSRGGADADVVREFDLVEKAFVEGGFTLPEAKSRVSWRDRDHLWVGTDFGAGSMTESGYPRLAKLWKRGTPLAEAELVAEGEATDVSISVYRDPTPGFERDILSRSLTFWTNEVSVREGDAWVRIPKPDGAVARLYREWLLVELRQDWTVGGRTFTAGSLLATDFERYMERAKDPDASFERTFEVLFAPSERTSLASFSPTRHHLILSTLETVKSRLWILTPPAPGNHGWKRAPLGGLPSFGRISARAVDALDSDEYFASVTGFLTPTSLYHGTAGGEAPKLLKAGTELFDASGLTVSQYEAESKDGTRIPYFEVKRGDLELDGSNPTLLYAYGGFELSMTPGYSAVRGSAWLERGGVYVLANIRGGGEFGPKWHQAALLANRPRAYEDVAAVARDLARRGVAEAERLAVMGGSNGGLMVGNMITKYPELFGAAVCQVPLLDMRRYHELLAGASWMGEYGDPDDPRQWEFIRTFSPYHNLDPEAAYPRTLFTTSTRDDRVHPGHARKMVARMRAQGHDVVYYENLEGGHGGAADNGQRAFMSTLAYSFLWRELAEVGP